MRRSDSFLVALLVVSATAIGCSRSAPPPAAVADAHRPVVSFPVSCAPAVQADFDRAVALLHHMTYPLARAAFRDIAARDPDCAMADWGIAMTLFQPLWPTRPSADDLRLGWETMQHARALKPPTAREQAFVDAAAAFFTDPESNDYWSRIGRWEASMAAAHAAFPDDPEVSAFYALALLASAKPGPTMDEHARQAVDLLLPILRTNPDHPGAMHYIVHADDMPGRERANLDIVHRYENAAPDNPHALHMPTHIYTRIGDWDGVIRGNLRAADAALKYPVGERGDRVWDEFPHAIEYLVYAYLQQGADDRAGEQIARLTETRALDPTAKTAFHLSSTRARFALERRDWAQAAALVAREPATIDWDRFPWPEAVTWFARGYGSVRTAELDESHRADQRLHELEDRAGAAGEDVFARQIRVLRLELEAWIAHASENDDGAIASLQQAVDLENATPKPAVTPAPTLPAYEILGDLLIELDRPHDALAAYEDSLKRYPRRFNSTLGAARALAAVDDTAGATRYYCSLLEIGEHGTRDALDEARAFVDAHPAGDDRAAPCPSNRATL